VTAAALPLPDDCGWVADTSCCVNFDSYPQPVQDRAISLAVQTLRALTGYRVGGCPVTVRPCRKDCQDNAVAWAWYVPRQTATGEWINACGCALPDCSCTTVCEVVLPGPVGRIDMVTVDDTVVPEEFYRVDNGNRLVWQGLGDCPFPLCQDMQAPVGEPSTFSVTYLRGIPVDGLGSYVAGVLACEFVRACSGESCRLPAGVTAVSRQGVTYEVQPSDFPHMRTGIPEVDAYLLRYNPYGMRSASTVWYPGMREPRTSGFPLPTRL
jgi:hypothetical protein